MLPTLFQNPRQQVFAKYKPQIEAINEIGKTLKNLTDKQLKERASALKISAQAGEAKEKMIPESFALVREATERVLGLRHFDVQLIGGLVLTEGKIAEMLTGEGKTLVAILPTFFYALYGKGTHIITVNDYLVRRDAEYVGQVHQFLGLSVGIVQEEMEQQEKKENYNCDVVYVTNSTLGFDYLRDNMALQPEELVQRPFFYCLIDEVDGVLIDEARTPLIISGANDKPTDKYIQTAKLATILRKDLHYKADEKTQAVTLTSVGVSVSEQALRISDLYDRTEPWISYILNSVKAKELFQRDKNYIIDEEDNVVIVDEFTGRTMQGRRWGDGLHQALEAKENVPIQDENQTVASITYQNLFLLYEILSGMTGTAQTEEGEFEKIYNLKVVPVPTNKPVVRKDFSDLIYKNQYTKWRAVGEECVDMFQLGRPVLVGTTTIEKSELLAALLSEYKIPYRLLNAKPENVESESITVAQAGCMKTVTIATNMAGRGTDILLGGNPVSLTQTLLRRYFIEQPTELETFINSSTLSSMSFDILSSFKKFELENQELKFSPEFIEFLEKPIGELENSTSFKAQTFLKLYKTVDLVTQEKVTEAGKTIRNLGGLHVIGTERHESRRIDNQLRGRAGRQGDPGSSRFFLSLDDKLLRIFGGDQILSMMQNIGFQDDVPIESPLLVKSLESAQKKVEAYYFDTRKQLFEYDEVLNTQRNCVYTDRRRILQQQNLKNWVLDYADRSFNDIFLCLLSNGSESLALQNKIKNLLGLHFNFTSSQFTKDKEEDYLAFYKQQVQIAYDLKELEMEIIEPGLLRELEKTFILQQIDYSWKEHLQKINALRDSIRWRAYGQKNPLTEYKKEAFNYYAIMLAEIRHRVTYFVFNSKVILM